MQTKCLRLMGKKLLVALTLEGKFSGEGLHDIEEDDDMLAAMARELVEKDGVSETADAVWSQLKQVYDQLPTQAPAMVDADPDVSRDCGFEDGSPATAVPISSVDQSDLLVPFARNVTAPTLFGQTLLSAKRRPKSTSDAVTQQGSLFGWN